MAINKQILICFILFSLPFIFRLEHANAVDPSRFHTDEELAHWKMRLSDMAMSDTSALFLTADRCQQCHGFDTAGIASVDILGNDINLFDDWEATMMANSAKDPFWRAKVSHEVLVNPGHQVELESKCTSCHAPLGHYNAIHKGQTYYSMAELLTDTLALDGVSCLACHQQMPDDLGHLHSGELRFDTAKVAYGPFTSPLASPMLQFTDYRPEFSEHISDAGLCAGCHTLITETADLEGNSTGNTFVEQATYHEWLNSRYNTDNISCQSCHLPANGKGMFQLVAGYDTAPRTPFYLHEMVGANTTMLALMKDNKDALGITASDEDFDQVILSTEKMLQQKTLSLQLSAIDRSIDTAFFELKLTNRAGHKFPSGYPARRAFIEFVVQTMEGDTVFASGITDDTFEVVGHDSAFEQHYDTIHQETQVQIYELVFGDVEGNVTTLLERGNIALKDNRLVPIGFTTSHSVYDTTVIAGKALLDANFNKENNVEGSGTDRIRYHIPTNGEYNSLIASAKIYYQATPPKWMALMFAESTPEIETFRKMFEAADQSPFLVKETSVEMDLFPVNVAENEEERNLASIQGYNNQSGQLLIQTNQVHDLTVFTVNGRQLLHHNNRQQDYQITLSYQGIVFLVFTNKEGIIETHKVFLY